MPTPKLRTHPLVAADHWDGADYLPQADDEARVIAAIYGTAPVLCQTDVEKALGGHRSLRIVGSFAIGLPSPHLSPASADIAERMREATIMHLASWLQAQLRDDIAYLGIAADQAAGLPTALGRSELTSQALVAARQTTAAADITRNVFIVHGRDGQAAAALAGFLESLGLRPLDWEALVAATGTAAPYLREVIVQGIAMAQAAVVLLTPDDTVWLHPDLHEPDEDDHEAAPTMQSRPNVLLELGMALATYSDRTVVLVAGKHRPMANLGGLNYIRLADGDNCLNEIKLRLQTAGCQLSDTTDGRRAQAWFSDLAAYTRRPTENR